MTFEVERSPDIMVMDDYGGHLYLDPDHPDRSKLIEKEQANVDRNGTPRLIHPHKYSERCGNIKHIRLSPHADAVELRILAK